MADPGFPAHPTPGAKCMVVDHRVKPCPGLKMGIRGVHQGRNAALGLTLMRLMNLSTFEVAYEYVILGGGEIPKEGLVLNFCPFCGNSLREPRKVE